MSSASSSITYSPQQIAEKIVTLVSANPISMIQILNSIGFISTCSSFTWEEKLSKDQNMHKNLANICNIYDMSSKKKTVITPNTNGTFDIRAYELSEEGFWCKTLALKELHYRDCVIRNVFDKKELMDKIKAFLEGNCLVDSRREIFNLHCQLLDQPLYEAPNMIHIQKVNKKGDIASISFNFNQQHFIATLDKTYRKLSFEPNLILEESKTKSNAAMFENILQNWAESNALIVSDVVYT